MCIDGPKKHLGESYAFFLGLSLNLDWTGFSISGEDSRTGIGQQIGKNRTELRKTGTKAGASLCLASAALLPLQL